MWSQSPDFGEIPSPLVVRAWIGFRWMELKTQDGGAVDWIWCGGGWFIWKRWKWKERRRGCVSAWWSGRDGEVGLIWGNNFVRIAGTTTEPPARRGSCSRCAFGWVGRFGAAPDWFDRLQRNSHDVPSQVQAQSHPIPHGQDSGPALPCLLPSDLRDFHLPRGSAQWPGKYNPSSLEKKISF